MTRRRFPLTDSGGRNSFRFRLGRIKRVFLQGTVGVTMKEF